jgi:hypothetical protein
LFSFLRKKRRRLQATRENYAKALHNEWPGHEAMPI